MLIEPEIAARHWEDAAVEQLAKELAEQGYSISKEEQINGYRADLVARKDSETIVYEFKAGRWSKARAHEVAAFRNHVVRELGAKFRLVVVTPPRQKTIEVADIEDMLAGALRKAAPAELTALYPVTRVEGVSDVEIASISVRPDGVEVEGAGTVRVTLHQGTGDEAPESAESFSFTFRVVRDPSGGLKEVRSLDVDVADWYSDKGHGTSGSAGDEETARRRPEP